MLNQPLYFLASSTDSSETDKLRSVFSAAYHEGFRLVFIVGAGLAAMAMLITVFLMPQVSLDRGDDVELKEEGRKADEESKRLGTC